MTPEEKQRFDDLSAKSQVRLLASQDADWAYFRDNSVEIGCLTRSVIGDHSDEGSRKTQKPLAPPSRVDGLTARRILRG
jgi:hypothetical protein